MLRENPESACTYILLQIARLSTSSGTDSSRLLEFAIGDLIEKAERLSIDIRQYFIGRAISIISKVNVDAARLLEPYMSAGADPKQSKRGQYDVVILTVIPVELRAALRAFGVPSDGSTAIPWRARDHYPVSLVRNRPDGSNATLNVLITMVGEPRNVPCANVVHDILERYDVDLMLLCGIGGGRAGKVKEVDVVGARSVVYAEGGKSALIPLLPFAYIQPEFDSENLSPDMRTMLPQYQFESGIVNEEALSIISSYSEDEMMGGSKPSEFNIKYHPEVVVCGEKVLADGSIAKLANRINRKIYAVDMESHGFSSSCKFRDQDWIVFRGISDLADGKKDDKKHVEASVAAAVVAKNFLAKTYKRPNERREF